MFHVSVIRTLSGKKYHGDYRGYRPRLRHSRVTIYTCSDTHQYCRTVHPTLKNRNSFSSRVLIYQGKQRRESQNIVKQMDPPPSPDFTPIHKVRKTTLLFIESLSLTVEVTYGRGHDRIPRWGGRSTPLEAQRGVPFHSNQSHQPSCRARHEGDALVSRIATVGTVELGRLIAQLTETPQRQISSTFARSISWTFRQSCAIVFTSMQWFRPMVP